MRIGVGQLHRELDLAEKRLKDLNVAFQRRARVGKPTKRLMVSFARAAEALDARKRRLRTYYSEPGYKDDAYLAAQKKKKNPYYSRKKRASAQRADIRTQRLIDAMKRRQRVAKTRSDDRDYERINKLMASAYRASRVSAKRETNPRKGGTNMAKRRKKWGSPAQRAALKKMQSARRRKHPKQMSLFKGKVAHRRRRRRSGGHGGGHRGRTSTRTISTTRVVTRRNPGIMSAAKETLTAAVPGDRKSVV